MMQPEWLRHRERANALAYRLIAWIARVLGRRLTRVLLYLITLYYVLRSRATVRASRQYLGKILKRKPRWREIFRHHYHFAATLLDRIYLYSDHEHVFDIRYYGYDKITGGGSGCLMLSAHMGSQELMRALSLRHHLVLNMMMYEENSKNIGAMTENLDRQHKRRTIPIGPIDALIVAQERLSRGEIVGLLGDRAVSVERLVRVPFLGQEASFPTGPFLSAAVLKVPVILFVCLYRGGNRYDLHFEIFADRITLDRRNPTDLEHWVQRYVERLEYYCRLEPYNWFNFYNFWASTPREAPDTGSI